MTIIYNDYIIDIINDDKYILGSADNLFNYEKVYSTSSDNLWYTHKHGLRIKKSGSEKGSAIICSGGGATTIHQNSAVIRNDTIFICCGNTIYSLNLPELDLNWYKETDAGTCFGIHQFNDDLLIHGEIDILRISDDGVVKWSFSARDIFVTIDGTKSFEISGTEIHLRDFEGYNYILNEKGETIE
ncbi:hypothetical protein [Mucilaginibacter endophyticus]|uniref:hypothetical protein n=1 Tax=Mucilaginibacter endophyticus TaxID=2675003 RepID=UPI000E0CE649|nr:hypothetical protein [Mucilaginibacter endophyticus]